MPAIRCHVIVAELGEACGKAATHLVTFADATKVAACAACALRLRELANAHGAGLRVESLAPGTS